MKYINKILGAILVLTVFYVGYSFIQLRAGLYTVYDVPDKYASGNIDADLVIVDFNKYGCDHCHSLHPILQEAIKRDGKVRYIPRTITHGLIWEETVSTAVYAAAEQGKFFEMHNMVYAKWPIADRGELFQYAADIGLDVYKLESDMSEPKTMELVRENQKFFEAWRLQRTPALLMGKNVIYRPADTPTVEELLDKFAKARR